MRRRHLLALTGAAVTAGALASAQKAWAAERVVGWISTESQETMSAFTKAFRKGLDSAVTRGGTTVRLIERSAPGGGEAVASAVADLQRAGAQVIVSQGAATLPVVRAKPSIPVVFGYSGDPVAAGIVESLARPGRSATGMTFMSIELVPKRIDFLRRVIPDCRRVALVSNARHPGEESEIGACRRAIEPQAIGLTVHRVQSANDLKPAVAEAADAGAQAMVVLPSALMVQNARMLSAECAARKLPLVSGWASIARSGALMTYGPNLEAAYVRIAQYVARVLDGASPAELPVEQPTAFELVINLGTAAAQGITVPPSLLAQADEIIE